MHRRRTSTEVPLAQLVGSRYLKPGLRFRTANWFATDVRLSFDSKRDNLAVSDPTAPVSVESERLLISLATYNEAGNLKSLVDTIRSYAPECWIVVIDDNSPDGTGKIADEISTSLPRIDVIHRQGKEGLGTAMLLAMRYAIASNFDYLINLDADFSHPPRFIPALRDGMRRSRRHDRLALCARRGSRRRLHAQAQADELGD